MKKFLVIANNDKQETTDIAAKIEEYIALHNGICK